MLIEYRPITQEGLIATAEMNSWAFGGPVGLVMYSPLEVNIPGGSATTACVDPVVVLPTHRRRGIMTEIMKQQLTNAFKRGLALSPLEAAESIIYGRFGYAIAAEHENWTIQRQDTAFRQQYEWNGSLKIVKADYAKVSFPNVFRRATLHRPGVIQPPKTCGTECSTTRRNTVTVPRLISTLSSERMMWKGTWSTASKVTPFLCSN